MLRCFFMCSYAKLTYPFLWGLVSVHVLVSHVAILNWSSKCVREFFVLLWDKSQTTFTEQCVRKVGMHARGYRARDAKGDLLVNILANTLRGFLKIDFMLKMELWRLYQVLFACSCCFNHCKMFYGTLGQWLNQESSALFCGISFQVFSDLDLLYSSLTSSSTSWT